MTKNQFFVEFSIIGLHSTGQAIFKWEKAPHTYALLQFRLRNPIQSRVIVRESEINIPFKIGRVSPENSQRNVKRGDVAYWPQGQTLIIFLGDKNANYPVNVVGFVEKVNMTFFDKLRIGTSIKLEKIQSAIDEADYI